MTAAGLDFVSDGRFILGLGASGSQVVEGFHSAGAVSGGGQGRGGAGALLEGSNLVGSEGHVRERIAAFAESGVTTLNVIPMASEKVKLIERLRRIVDRL